MSVQRWATPAAFVVAGVSLATYPALRPYSDETALEGADAMASNAWVASHSLAMVGFLALVAGTWTLARGHAFSRAGVVLGLLWAGTSLVLPYYGAETFGLQVIGERAVADGDPGLLQLAETFRYGAVPMAFFATGLLLMAAAGATLAVSVRRATSGLRLGGTLVALGLLTYLPQFFVPAAGRIGHGLVLGLGCVVVAAAQRPARTAAAVSSRPVTSSATAARNGDVLAQADSRHATPA